MAHDVAIAVVIGAGLIQKGLPQLRVVQGVVAHAHKVAEV